MRQEQDRVPQALFRFGRLAVSPEPELERSRSQGHRHRGRFSQAGWHLNRICPGIQHRGRGGRVSHCHQVCRRHHPGARQLTGPLHFPLPRTQSN